MDGSGKHGGAYNPGDVSPVHGRGHHGGGFVPTAVYYPHSNESESRNLTGDRNSRSFVPRRPVRFSQRNLTDSTASSATQPYHENEYSNIAQEVASVPTEPVQQDVAPSSNSGYFQIVQTQAPAQASSNAYTSPGNQQNLMPSNQPTRSPQSPQHSWLPSNAQNVSSQTQQNWQLASEPPSQPMTYQDMSNPPSQMMYQPQPPSENLNVPTGPSRDTRERMGFMQSEKGSLIDSALVDEENDVPRAKLTDDTPLKGYRHIFSKQTTFHIFHHPHFYRPAQLTYDTTISVRHKDTMWRIRKWNLDDRFISPFNARARKLVVQTVDGIYEDASNKVTWDRTFIRDISPWHLRLANWPANHIDYRATKLTFSDWFWLLMKYFPASTLLILVISFPGNVEGEIRNGGRYDSFPYRFHGYSKVARNVLEEKEAKRYAEHGQKTCPVVKNRLLRPRYLNFLDRKEYPGVPGVTSEAVNVDKWILEHEDEDPPRYLMVTYTAEQFKEQDFNELLRIAELATRAEGLSAFWCGATCMPGDDRQLEQDVWRISDVIRGATAICIAISIPRHDRDGTMQTIESMLRQWGERVWTFPEVLLSPKSKTIKVYLAGAEESPVLTLDKNQFAARVWDDAEVSRQLIDHYEGNLILSRLELVTLALQCLYSRKKGKYLEGDHSYALMGLLRVRPEVDKTDTDFQAFARLSLANDSDLLLERLACVLPRDPQQPWYTMDDAYEVNLWDIYPECRVAGIGEDNTIIVDGARGANVRWKSFASVHVRRRWSWWRLICRISLHTSSIVFFLGILMFMLADLIIWHQNQTADEWVNDIADSLPLSVIKDKLHSATRSFVRMVVKIVIDANVVKGWGILFMLWSIPMLLVAPKAIRILYGGKLWNTQPWLFGFEGYLPIEQIEVLIFGDRRGRLRWHPFGSPLSRHQVDEYMECIPVDPATFPEVKELIEKAKIGALGDQKIFTLVDTSTLTVTLFTAARPPIAFFLLAAEGGMQRAMGCSYDWTTGTLYRETVLRMDTSCKDKMDLVSRARISLERRREKAVIVRLPKNGRKKSRNASIGGVRRRRGGDGEV